ncbi:hypothetical protein [Actimicrobium sp. GrIS 1.19]|uniref:hypothetical protein n=1 Tax=Actimicrobium sp. GrIS 1.19 TaxID=3071708 RepID=UPI003FA36B02
MIEVMALHTGQTFSTGVSALQFLAGSSQFGVQLFIIISAFTMCLTFELRIKV